MVPKIKIYNTLRCTIYTDYDNCTMTANAYADKLFEALEEDDADLVTYADCEEYDEETGEYYENEWEVGRKFAYPSGRTTDTRS